MEKEEIRKRSERRMMGSGLHEDWEPNLSIVIPCFNEKDGIIQTVDSVLLYLKKNYAYYGFELILVDDGSVDGTRVILDELAQQYSEIRTIFFRRNLGRGAAVTAGIKESKGKYIITLDADLSYDVEHIGRIISNFEKEPKTDVVVVSPYMKGGKIKGVPLYRLAISRMANWILSGFFAGRLSTVTCVVRGYRGALIREIPLFEKGKELHLEVLRKLVIFGASIKEIPGNLYWKEKKKRGKRKANLNIMNAATRHILYGMLIKPTRLFKYVAMALLFVGLYETSTIVVTTYQAFELLPQGGGYSLWKALSFCFAQSPHTFLIAGVCLMLGLQSCSYLALLQVLKLQQEETLRHLLAIIKDKPTVTEKF